MAEIAFSTPTTLQDAARALADEGTLALAGGTNIGLMLRQRLIEPTGLVSLGGIPELNRIERDASGRLQIGAAATLAQLSSSEVVRAAHPSLAKAASVVGNARVRAVATIGGAIAHADARQDVPPVLVAHDAAVETVDGSGNERTIPIREFYRGLMDTALNDDELIARVVMPVPDGGIESYHRYTPGSMEDWPTVSVAIAGVRGTGGVLERLDLGLGAVASVVLHVPGAQLCGGEVTRERIADFARHAATFTDPVSDRLGSEAYKREMAAVLVERHLAELLL